MATTPAPGGNVVIVGEERVQATFTRLRTYVRNRMRAAVYEGGLMLQRHIMANKLSGQVLKVRTNMLRSSIALDPPGQAADDGKTISIRVGTNRSYGIAWELGLKDHEIRPRRKRFLRFQSGGKVVFARRVFWRTQVHKRPFLVPALAELQTAIRAKLHAAIQGANRGEQG